MVYSCLPCNNRIDSLMYHNYTSAQLLSIRCLYMFFCLGGGKSFLQTMLAILEGFYKTQELLRLDALLLAPKVGSNQ